MAAIQPTGATFIDRYGVCCDLMGEEECSSSVPALARWSDRRSWDSGQYSGRPMAQQQAHGTGRDCGTRASRSGVSLSPACGPARWVDHCQANRRKGESELNDQRAYLRLNTRCAYSPPASGALRRLSNFPNGLVPLPGPVLLAAPPRLLCFGKTLYLSQGSISE